MDPSIVNTRSHTSVLRWLVRLGALLALAVALATLGLLAAGYLGGVDIMQPLGGLWFAVDAGSLNAMQVVIERHIWPPLWSRAVFPVLNTSAPLVALFSSLAAIVLLWLGWRRHS
ncbi:MAG: hypothetical protein JJT95_07295 [Pararhodobacter sp.]|nr:hypothetical protein [Pararhodobacter sp.]